MNFTTVSCREIELISGRFGRKWGNKENSFDCIENWENWRKT